MDGGIQQTDSVVAEIQGWGMAFAEVERRLAPYFRRTEARQRAMGYLHGLLGPAVGSM